MDLANFGTPGSGRPGKAFPAAGALLALWGLAAAAGPAEDAAELYAGERWAEAAEAYSALANATPASGQFQFRAAVASRRAGNLSAAGDHLTAASAAGVPEGYLDVERVKLALAADDRAAALTALAAAGASVPSPALLESDTELDALRETPEFAAAVSTARELAMPCESMPEARQFDFWVGQWRVEDAGGTYAGDNHIRKVELGCMLVESWTGQSGGTGTSINYYDPVNEQWVQNWVGLNLLIDLRGGLSDGSMVLEGTIHYFRGGTTSPFRGTWTPMPDGVVRQHFEQSADDGQTWTTWFDGYYHPIE
jgi:hypothetical protein